MRESPDNAEVRKRADAPRWRLRQRPAAPAETALQEIVRRPYRDDPEAVMARLASLSTENLPQDLARRAFGLWSNPGSSGVKHPVGSARTATPRLPARAWAPHAPPLLGPPRL